MSVTVCSVFKGESISKMDVWPKITVYVEGWGANTDLVASTQASASASS